MIKRTDLFSIPFYDKTNFSGSYLGMHYRIEKVKQEDGAILLATYWPGPKCFAATDEELKKTNTFDYSTQGLDLACDWLNQMYEEHTDIFKYVHP